jgi:hypothetical protein
MPLAAGKEQSLPIVESPKDLDAPIDTAGRQVCSLFTGAKQLELATAAPSLDCDIN